MTEELEERLRIQRASIKKLTSKMGGMYDGDIVDTKEEFKTMTTKEEVMTVIFTMAVVFILYYLATT